jgi:hypothetical protein
MEHNVALRLEVAVEQGDEVLEPLDDLTPAQQSHVRT